MHKLHGLFTSLKSGTICVTRPPKITRQSQSLIIAGASPNAIRQAVHADLHDMQKLSLDGNIGWSVRQLQAELELDISTVLVSSSGDRVDGFTCGWHVDSELQVMALAVLRDERQRGIGRALLEQLLLTGRSLGDKLAFLEFREGNEAAMRLYSSAGFEQVGRRRNYYENGDAAILMAKDL